MSVTNQSIWRSLWQRSHALDRLTVGYILAFAIALAAFGRGDVSWPLLVATHLSLAAIIAVMIVKWHDRTDNLAGLVRHLYPAMLYPFLYREMQVANFWLFPEFLDERVVAFERAIFGVEPNIWIIPAQTAWINELMMLGYFSYYLIIPIVALILFLLCEFDDLRAMLHGSTMAFVISYIGFVTFPIEGPRYFLATQFSEPLQGWLFVPLVNAIIGTGAIRGGCMPSSHVAVALVVLFWARRALPRLGAALTPFVVIMIFATAWGRFHYITDAIAGIVVGLGALFLTGFWARSEARQTIAAKSMDAAMEGARIPT